MTTRTSSSPAPRTRHVEHFPLARTAARIAPWTPAAPPPAPAPAAVRDARSCRVLVARTGRSAGDPVSIAAAYLEAAGSVRCVEVEASALADPGALARLLGDGDAVLTASLGATARDALLAPLRVTVRIASGFGSAVPAPRPLRPDVPIVAPIAASADAWEHAAAVAFAMAEAERREEVWCAVRDPGWPLLASDRARRFRRAALRRVGVLGRRLSLADVRRRLLFPDGAGPDVLLADARELDGLVRAAVAGVGWSNAVPSLHLGDGVALAEVASGCGKRPPAANGQLAFAAARLAARVLRRLRQPDAARRLDAAVAAELVALSRGPLDAWIELASEPAIRFAGALLDRLGAPAQERRS